MAVHHNRYELLERIGVGGMAEVFRARMVGPAGFQKVVALKRILEDFCSDQDFLHRFIDEARLTARLQHPNICQVLDFGMINDRDYLTLEYVHGLDLAQVLGRLEYHGNFLAPELTLQVISGVLRGLAHAHRAMDERGRPLGIVHRDVSPQNVLLSINGDIKLSDFGAAKADAAVRQARTQENIALGKLAYMAPEQRRGKTVDGRSDVYGVGVLLAEMLQGPTLFRRSTSLGGIDREHLAEITEERFPASVAPRLAAILNRALDPQRTRRFDDALAMLEEVERCAVELGLRASTDQLGDLVRHLMEDQEFLTGRHKKRDVPIPGAIVTTSFASDPEEIAGSAPDSADLHEGSSLDETSVDSLDDTVDSRGLDSLEHMLDASNVAYAPTQLAAVSSMRGEASEELATRVVKGMAAPTPDASTLIFETNHEDEIALLRSEDFEIDEDDFEKLETRVIKGPTTPLPAAARGTGHNGLGIGHIPIDQATTGKRLADDSPSPPTLPKIPAKVLRPAKPPPTLPTVPGLGLRPGLSRKRDKPSQPPVAPPPVPQTPPLLDKRALQESSAARRKMDHRSDQPGAFSLPQWEDASPEVSTGERPGPAPIRIGPDEEDDPTHVDQSPQGWKEEVASVEPHDESELPRQTPPQGHASKAAETALVRRGRHRRRHPARYVIIGLIIAICLALWGAFAVIGWLSGTSRSPWPLQSARPTESNASAQPLLPMDAEDAEPRRPSPQDAMATTQAPERVSPSDQQRSPGQSDSATDSEDGARLKSSARERREIEKRGTHSTKMKAQPSPSRSVQDAGDLPETASRGSRSSTHSAFISILADPPGRAYVDGGLVSSRTPVRNYSLSPGSHTVRVVFSSTGESVYRTVIVGPGDHEVVRFSASR